MRKWYSAAVATAVLAVGGAGAGAAWAADLSMDPKTATTCAPSGMSLALTAEGHKFDKDCLAVPAGESFTIRFDNRDDDRHNVAILPSHTSTELLFQGDIIPGPKSTVYAVPNMKAGTYHFHCEVHPNLMNGTFIVAAAPPKPGAPTTAPTMSMGNDKPAASAAPTPKMPDAMPAEPPKAAAAPAAPAPKPAPTATPAPARTANSAAPAPKTAAAAGSNLPHTGPSTGLLLLAGLALAAGGLAVLGGARGAAAKS